jgi:hypothetical protein
VIETVAHLANLPLNCPHCGKPMRCVRVRTPDGTLVANSEAADVTVYIYSCANTAPFRFSRDIPVRPGA